MRSLKDGNFQVLNCLKEGIGRFFISHGSPKDFLVIQFWMVGRKIVKMQLAIIHTKFLHPPPFMPLGPIDPEVYNFPLEAKDNAIENLQKAIRIPLYPFHHPMQPIERGYPPKDTQSFLMLTKQGFTGQIRMVYASSWLMKKPMR